MKSRDQVGEHMKSSTEEFPQLHQKKHFHQGPDLNVSVQMCIAWEMKKRN